MKSKSPKRPPRASAEVHPPLKRHPALQPFSRDHYVGLVQAQHLLCAAGGKPDDRRTALREFLEAWTRDIAQHFDDEDRILGALLSTDQRHHLDAQHREIRALVEGARHLDPDADPGPEWLENLGQKLNDHIRWEERQLFPAVEESAGPQVLEQLGLVTGDVERRRPRSGRAAK